MKENKKLLIVAAHPDDEVLGCGATVAKLVKSGWTAYTLILGEGVTSRSDTRDPAKQNKELIALRESMERANRIIGVKEVFTSNLPDNRFDGVDMLEIVKTIEKAINFVKPELVFTHYHGDLNIDHRVTFNAALTACRPLKEECVKEIYSFEVRSSTEWNFPHAFRPACFWDIQSTLGVKLKAMREYQSELNNYPHPRSLKGIQLSAEYWGMFAGLRMAEAFVLVRSIK
jgi:LmbE family N-acetylglucosaminyl deacetylase